MYGYNLAPAAGYFGAKKGNEALHVQYSYDDKSVVVVNHGAHPVSGLVAHVRVYDRDAKERFSKEATIDVGEDGTTKVLSVPELSGLSSTYFVDLALEKDHNLVSSNFYWLSQKPELIDFSHTDNAGSATSQYADYADLEKLGPATVQASVTSGQDRSRTITRVTLENRSEALAFFMRLKMTRGKGGEQVVPVLWQDNYVSLAPKQKREITVTCETSDLRGATPAVEVSGWNVAPQVIGE